MNGARERVKGHFHMYSSQVLTQMKRVGGSVIVHRKEPVGDAGTGLGWAVVGSWLDCCSLLKDTRLSLCSLMGIE